MFISVHLRMMVMTKTCDTAVEIYLLITLHEVKLYLDFELLDLFITLYKTENVNKCKVLLHEIRLSNP